MASAIAAGPRGGYPVARVAASVSIVEFLGEMHIYITYSKTVRIPLNSSRFSKIQNQVIPREREREREIERDRDREGITSG